MALFGFLMAYWTAYIIVGKGKGPMGRFIMLTYNLSALYAYSLSVADQQGREDQDEEDGTKGHRPLIFAIALHRVVAVLSGCIWGLIVTRMIWPISARDKIRDGLSLLWLRMGMVWRRDPLSVFLQSGDRGENEYMHLREEMQFTRFLSALRSLVEAAKSEFELRGPFPAATYNRILDSTGRMLDAFHAMNVVILKDLKASGGEERLLRATEKERKQLGARIGHLFGVLASSMKICYPVLGGGPGADGEQGMATVGMLEGVRDRLLAKVFVIRKQTRGENGRLVAGLEVPAREQQEEADGEVQGDTRLDEGDEAPVKDADFGLLYTYALVTGQLGVEIRQILSEIEDLFGVLDDDFLRLQ